MMRSGASAYHRAERSPDASARARGCDGKNGAQPSRASFSQPHRCFHTANRAAFPTCTSATQQLPARPVRFADWPSLSQSSAVL
jgi:hypothetical protein